MRERGYVNKRLNYEDVAEFDYRPTQCRETYRMVVVRKNISKMKGDLTLMDEIRHFFYITTRRDLSADQIVRLANARCDQENVIEQLKNGVNALRVPMYDLVSNWAYMVMAALAWNLKNWFALMMHLKADRRKYIAMEFRRFIREMILLPCQVIRRARRTHAADHRLAAHHRPPVQHLEHDRTDRLRLTLPPGPSPLPPGADTPLAPVSPVAKTARPTPGRRLRNPPPSPSQAGKQPRVPPPSPSIPHPHSPTSPPYPHSHILGLVGVSSARRAASGRTSGAVASGVQLVTV